MFNVQFNKYNPKIYNLGDKNISDYTTRQLKNGPQDYSELVKKHSPTNPFKDPEFGYNNEDFGNLEGKDMFDSAKPDSFYNNWKDEGWDGTVEWIRISDVVKMAPSNLDGNEEVVFKYGPSCDAISRNDIAQGIIGNCWFLAALGTVACNKYLIEAIVLDDNVESLKAGILHFRFWFQGYWVDVVVDDTLPCVRHNFGKNLWPLSSSIHKQDGVLECWVPFIEKAYAKLHGSYQNLVGNNMKYAFENLTGGLIEDLNFHDSEKPVPPGLYDYLKNSFNQHTLINLACHEAKQGLCSPHAYSITGFAEVDTTDGQHVQLVRIRNPHGGGEWTGDWNDSDEKNWNKVLGDQKKTVKLDKRDDGEFWMSYSDMLIYFACLDIVYWTEEDKVNTPESRIRFVQVHGSWTLAKGGEGANFLEGAPWDCPQYLIQVDTDSDSKEDCLLIISLGLKQNVNNSYAPGAIGVRVFEVHGNSLQKKDKKFFDSAKEMERVDNAWISDPGRVTLRGFKVPAGKYVITPFMNDGHEGKFYLRILCNKKPKK